MSKFRPTRTSPPSKLAPSIIHANLSEISRSSVVSVPELAGLTPEDVEILDAVVQRAAPSATTFLTVFKAYNDVLQERGLDPHEVVYYGKLLKLGTLRGKNWGDKWRMVKAQYGYDSRRPLTQPSKPSTVLPPHGSTPLNTRFLTHRRDDSFTLHSHQDDSVETQSEPDLDQVTRTLASSKEKAFKTPSSGFTLASAPQLRPGPHSQPRGVRPWDSETSDATELNPASISTTPPSYRAAARDPVIRRYNVAPHSVQISRPLSTPIQTTPRYTALVKERRGSVVNEDEAWNKIKMIRDEKEADRFREDKLVERCWEVWKQGFLWIHVRLSTSFFPFDCIIFDADNSSASCSSSRGSSYQIYLPTLAKNSSIT
jgi:protein SFI1